MHQITKLFQNPSLHQIRNVACCLRKCLNRNLSFVNRASLPKLYQLKFQSKNFVLFELKSDKDIKESLLNFHQLKMTDLSGWMVGGFHDSIET